MSKFFILGLLLLILVGGGFFFKDALLISETRTPATSNTRVPTVAPPKVLDLSNKNLTKTPESVFSETGAEELNLSNNLLEGSLQAEIRHLQNLKVLNLSNNKFTGIPAEVGQLSKLEVLDVSNNEITGLPYELGNLKNLKILNLSGNDYSEADLAKIQEGLPANTQIIK